MKEKIKEVYKDKKIYFIYTILFGILALLIYLIFILQGKSFIWSDDGLKQHFAILYDFNQNIRNIFKNGFQTFSWEIGLGLDVIGQYSYYILGDPFAYLSLLFPMNKLELAYNILVIVRMYFIGIAFLAYCRYNKKETFNSLLGCMIYTFSGFVLYAGVRHPYFLNAVILLPLVFLGIDKLLKEDKLTFFVTMIAITGIVNYYFLYMITILSFIYAVVKYISEYKKLGIKVFIKKFLKACLGYIIGILIAGIILLPTIYGYENSNRLLQQENVKYTLGYYASLFSGYTSNVSLYWTRICTASVTLIMLPISILNMKKNKENRTILINIIITTIMLLIPFFGSAMNGFSFSTNRWSFGYVFLLSYMVVLNFRKDLVYNKKELISMGITLAIYYIGIIVLCLMQIYLKKEVTIVFSLITTLFALIIFIIILSLNYMKNNNKIKSEGIFKNCRNLIFVIVLVNIIFYGYNLYYESGKKYINEFVKSGKVINQYNNYERTIKKFNRAIATIKKSDKSFYRIGTSEYKNVNISIVKNYKSLNSYLSIGNKYIGKLSSNIQNRVYSSKTNALKEFDNRTKITTLLGTKYFITDKNKSSFVPYGYKLINEISSKERITQIYENENSLGLGLFYDNYILEEEYNKLTALEKEQALLDTAVIENNLDSIKHNKDLISDLKNKVTKNVGYTIADSDNILNKKKINVKKEKQKITLNIDEAKDCELYILIKGFKYDLSEKNSIEIKYKDIIKTQNFRDKEKDPYYFYNPDILINLGYRQIHNGNIEISFANKGKYSFEDIKLFAVPMDVYKNSINKLKENEFKLEKYNNKEIIGNIENNASGILQLSIPYTDGWTAYVDGKKTNTFVVNTAFIGIELSGGKHSIVLKYETPYLNFGIIFTTIGLISFIAVCLYEVKYKKWR